MAQEEIPIQHGEWARVVTRALLSVINTTFAVIAHTIDIGTAARIWLCGEHSPVCILRHTDHIGNHDPFGGIDVTVPHPTRELLWVNACNERKIAKHHEAFNVVRV